MSRFSVNGYRGKREYSDGDFFHAKFKFSMVPLRDSLPTVPETAGRKAAAVRLQDLLRRGRQNKKTLHLQSPYI